MFTLVACGSGSSDSGGGQSDPVSDVTSDPVVLGPSPVGGPMCNTTTSEAFDRAQACMVGTIGGLRGPDSNGLTTWFCQEHLRTSIPCEHRQEEEEAEDIPPPGEEDNPPPADPPPGPGPGAPDGPGGPDG